MGFSNVHSNTFHNSKKKIGRKEGRKERRQSKYPLSRLKQYNLVNGSSEGESLKLYFE